MVHLSGATGYLHEPFNPNRRPGWSGGRIPYWYLYVTQENERFYEPVLDDVLSYRYSLRRGLKDLRGVRAALWLGMDLPRSVAYRVTRPRPLLKDPFALFSAEWLQRRYGVQTVVMIRHPAAFAGSIKRLNWRFRFRSWLAQDALLRDWLEPFRTEMRKCSSGQGDIIDQAVVMWNAIHHVILGYRRMHPDWLFVRHEDLAADPVRGFARMYEHFGLRFDDRTARRITGFSSEPGGARGVLAHHDSIRRNSRAATQSWRTRLTDEEVRRIRVGTGPIASHFYEDFGPEG
jgi:hypothetical protein